MDEMKQLIQSAMNNNPLVNQNNPIIQFFIAESHVERGELNEALNQLDQSIQIMEPFEPEKLGYIAEDGSNIHYSPLYASIYFQAQMLRSNIVLEQENYKRANERVDQAVAQLERVCFLLWTHRRLFEMFDALALFRVQHAMIQLPVTYVKRGEIVKAVQFLRKFFLPDGDVGPVIPVQRQAKERALLLLGNILARYMTDHLYYNKSVDAPEGLQFNASQQVNDMKRLEQPLPRMVRSRTATRLAQKNAPAASSENDVYIVAQNWVEEALLSLLSLERLTSPTSRFNYKITSVSVGVKGNDMNNNTMSQLYDNITMLLSEHKKYYSLMSILERGLSRYNEDVHFWNQFALVLIKAKKYYRAIKVLEEIISIDPSDANSHLLIAKICIQHLPGKTKLALEHAKQAVDIQGFFSGKSYHVLGLVYSKLAKESNSRTERRHYEEKAVESLKRAYEFDSEDYLLCYHLALHYAESRDTQKAYSFVRKSLSLHSRFVSSWILLALLFTCEKDYVQALKTAKIGLLEHPKNIKLTLISARLHEIVSGEEKAKKVYEKLLKFLNSYRRCENIRLNIGQEASGDGRSNPSVSDGLYLKLKSRALKIAKYYLFISDAYRRFELDSNNLPDALNKILEAKELIGNIILESSAELTTVPIPQQNGGEANAYSDAFEAFVSNAHHFVMNVDANYVKQIQLLCADICFHEGRYREDTGDIESATKRYESALVCNANHLQALVRLGVVLHTQDQTKCMLARSFLQTAVQVDPSSYEAWYHLGMVQKMMGDLSGSSESLMASLKLEQTSALIPFDYIIFNRIN